MVDGGGGGGEAGMSDPGGVTSEDKGGGYGQTTPIDPASDGPAQVGPSSNEPTVPAATTGETILVQQPQEMGGGSDADEGAISVTSGVAGEGSSGRDDGDPQATSEATVEVGVVSDGRSAEQEDDAKGVGAAVAPPDPDVNDEEEPQGENKLPAPLPATMSMAASSQHIDGMFDGSFEMDPDLDLGVKESDGGKGHQHVVNAAESLPATPKSAPREEQEEQDEFDYDIYVTHEHGKDNEEETKVLERVWRMIDDLRGHNMPGTERPIRVYTASESENHEDDEWMRSMWSSACVVVAVSQSYVDKVNLWSKTPEEEHTCKKEFGYAFNVVKPRFMVPIRIDGTQDPSTTSCAVGRILKENYMRYNLDLSSADDDAQVIYEEVIKIAASLREDRTGGVLPFQNSPSIIQSLQTLVQDERRATVGKRRDIREKNRRDGGDSDDFRVKWLDNQTKVLDDYEQILEGLLKIDQSVQQKKGEQEMVRQQAAELSRKHEQDLTAMKDLIDRENYKREQEFKRRLEEKKRRQREKKREEGIADGAAAEGTEEEKETEEEREERMKMEAQSTADMQAILERKEQQMQELERLKREAEKIEEGVEAEKQRLAQAEQQAAELAAKIQPVHDRLEMLKRKKELQRKNKEFAEMEKMEKEMDDKTRKTNKKLADLRRKEEEFIQKMMEAEERKDKLKQQEINMKKQREEEKRLQEAARRESAQRKKDEENAKSEKKRKELERDQGNFYREKEKKEKEWGAKVLEGVKPRVVSNERPKSAERPWQQKSRSGSREPSPGRVPRTVSKSNISRTPSKSSTSRPTTGRPLSAARGRSRPGSPTGGVLGGAATALQKGKDAVGKGIHAGIGQVGVSKGLRLEDLTSRTISSITTTVDKIAKNKITGSETLCMHFTNEQAARQIDKDGIRPSADGQGGGGFYVVKADLVGKVLKSKSKKLDRECFLKCLVSLYGVVNAKEKFERSPDEAIKNLNVLMLIKIPSFFLEPVVLEESDERRGMCELHYVSKERIIEKYDLDEDDDDEIPPLPWQKKILKWMKIFSPTTCHSPKVSIDQLFTPKLIGSAEVYTFGDDQEEPRQAGKGGDEGNHVRGGQEGDLCVEQVTAILPPEILRKLQELERRNEELEAEIVLRESVSSKEGERIAEGGRETGQEGQMREETVTIESQQEESRAAREEEDIRRRMIEELRAEGMLVGEKSEQSAVAAAAPVDEEGIRNRLLAELMLEGRLVDAGSKAPQVQAVDEDAVRKKLMDELEREGRLTGGGGASGGARGEERMPDGVVVEKYQGVGEDVRGGGTGERLDAEVEKMMRQAMVEREKLRVEREEWMKRKVEEEEAGREGLQRQKEEIEKQKDEMERLMRLEMDESERKRQEEVERLNKIIQDESIARNRERLQHQHDELEEMKAKILQLEQANASLASNGPSRPRPVYFPPPVPVSYQPHTTAGANQPHSLAIDRPGPAAPALYPSSGGGESQPATVATTQSPSANVLAAATAVTVPAANVMVGGCSTATPVDTPSASQGGGGYSGVGEPGASTEKRGSFAGVKKKSSACVIQ